VNRIANHDVKLDGIGIGHWPHATGRDDAAPPRCRSRLIDVGERCYANRLTNASAVSATSRQPLSIVSECPRSGTLTISVTPSLPRCFLNAAFAMDHGTV
jgi:hypothetical protein